MIELYTWGTPNGRKISIMLEEIRMPYNVHPVNLGNNEQKRLDSLATAAHQGHARWRICDW